MPGCSFNWLTEWRLKKRLTNVYDIKNYKHFATSQFVKKLLRTVNMQTLMYIHKKLKLFKKNEVLKMLDLCQYHKHFSVAIGSKKLFFTFYKYLRA